MKPSTTPSLSALSSTSTIAGSMRAAFIAMSDAAHRAGAKRSAIHGYSRSSQPPQSDRNERRQPQPGAGPARLPAAACSSVLGRCYLHLWRFPEAAYGSLRLVPRCKSRRLHLPCPRPWPSAHHSLADCWTVIQRAASLFPARWSMASALRLLAFLTPHFVALVAGLRSLASSGTAPRSSATPASSAPGSISRGDAPSPSSWPDPGSAQPSFPESHRP